MASDQQLYVILGYLFEDALVLMTPRIFRTYTEASDYLDTVHPSYRAFIAQAV